MRTFDSVISAHLERANVLEANSNPLAHGVAWVHGKLYPVAEAQIPMLDQGFLHSDLTYDVPAVWDGRFFRLDDHIDRFFESCAKLRLVCPMDKSELKATLVEMVAASSIRDAYVEMIVTRGFRFVRDGGSEPHINHVYLMVVPYVWAFPLAQMKEGSSAVVTRTVRRVPPGAIDPTVKNLQWGDLTRGLQEANDRGALYPLLPDGDGNITEGAGYNIFVVKDGVLTTPRRGVLEGVTRRTVLEIAAERGWEARVEEVPQTALYNADEIFLSTTAGGIMPIVELDGEPVADGKVGRYTAEVWDTYWAAHYNDKYSFAVTYPELVEVAA